MKTIILSLVVAIVIGSVAGCGDSDDGGAASPSGNVTEAADATPATISGEVTQVVAPVQDQSLGAIVVEAGSESENQFTRAGITVDGATVYSRNDGATTVPATFEDLKVGARVKVTFRGNVAGSVIVSGRAGEIIILE